MTWTRVSKNPYTQWENKQKQKYNQARKGSDSWTLSDWESYSQSDAPKIQGYGYTQGQRKWRGGGLSPEDYSRVQYLEQQGLENEYKTAYDEAKAANEERYQEIKGGYADRYKNAMNKMGELGDQDKKDNQELYRRVYAGNMSNAIKSGLYGTTVLPSMNLKTASEEASSLARINQNRGLKEAYLAAELSGDKLGFMERREDEYPDQALYTKLAMSLGNA